MTQSIVTLPGAYSFTLQPWHPAPLPVYATVTIILTGHRIPLGSVTLASQCAITLPWRK